MGLDIKEFFPVLRESTFFFNENDDEIMKVLSELDGEYSCYSKGELLHISGKELTKFGIVLYGCIQVMIDDIEGNRAIMAEVTKGNTFGESLCFLKIKNPEIYIRTSENSGVIWLSVDKLFTGVHSKQIDKLEKRFVEMVAKRTLALNNRIQILSKLTLRDKIITYFTFMAKNNPSCSIEIPINREDMAVYIGTNRSALSRELSKMKKEGLIDYKKNRFILKFK